LLNIKGANLNQFLELNILLFLISTCVKTHYFNTKQYACRLKNNHISDQSILIEFFNFKVNKIHINVWIL